MLYTLRPVIYAAAMKYFDEVLESETTNSPDNIEEDEDGGVVGLRELYRKMRSYLSWLISLVVDLTSISISSLALRMVRKKAEVRILREFHCLLCFTKVYCTPSFATS